MTESIQFFPIHYAGDDLAPLWADVAKHWALRGGTTDIIASLKDRVFNSPPGVLNGVVAYQRGIPVSMGWVEKTSDTYGNMFIHSLHPQFRKLIPTYIVSHGLLDTVFAELVHFEDTLEYRKYFLELGAHENARQRMGVDISGFTPVPCEIPDLVFAPLTLEDSPITAKISAHAHRFSKDYQGFWDLESVPHRMAMDKRLFENFYGTLIPEAALKAVYKGEIVGSTASVEVNCWGYEAIPWVFDISIDEKYRGRGFGRALFLELMSNLARRGYPVMGLAVTMSNTFAVRLYESFGFTITDAFFEFTTSHELEPAYDD